MDIKTEKFNTDKMESPATITTCTFHLDEIKIEVSGTNLHDELMQRDIVKQEHSSIKPLYVQVKSEIPDIKHEIAENGDHLDVKPQTFPITEIIIKNETCPTNQASENAPQDQNLICALCSNYECICKTRLKRTKNEFKCIRCEYKSTHKSSFQRHIMTHTGERSFKCTLCDYTCIVKTNLQRHMVTHTGLKPFTCTICDYKCVQKTSLQQHMQTHTGNKLFTCNICAYKCNDKSNLQRHVKIHTGEKPFQCNMCDQKFIQKPKLRQHLMTHTGEKPFKCTVCDYKSSVKATLHRHMKTHTGEKSF